MIGQSSRHSWFRNPGTLRHCLEPNAEMGATTPLFARNTRLARVVLRDHHHPHFRACLGREIDLNRTPTQLRPIASADPGGAAHLVPREVRHAGRPQHRNHGAFRSGHSTIFETFLQKAHQRSPTCRGSGNSPSPCTTIPPSLCPPLAHMPRSWARWFSVAGPRPTRMPFFRVSCWKAVVIGRLDSLERQADR